MYCLFGFFYLYFMIWNLCKHFMSIFQFSTFGERGLLAVHFARRNFCWVIHFEWRILVQHCSLFTMTNPKKTPNLREDRELSKLRTEENSLAVKLFTEKSQTLKVKLMAFVNLLHIIQYILEMLVTLLINCRIHDLGGSCMKYSAYLPTIWTSKSVEENSKWKTASDKYTRLSCVSKFPANPHQRQCLQDSVKDQDTLPFRKLWSSWDWERLATARTGNVLPQLRLA